MMLVRPEGLLPEYVRRRELHEESGPGSLDATPGVQVGTPE